MTYREKLVAVIKVGGRVLREDGETVTLPFGSEYSILLKNLDSVRMQVKVSVDGTDATDGTRLIIGPNSDLELERFIRAGNLNAGNRFKFIERSPAVEQHRGIGAEDGLVRVEAWTEKIVQIRTETTEYHYHYPYPWPYIPPPAPLTPPWSRPRPHFGETFRRTNVGAPASGITGSSTASNTAFLNNLQKSHTGEVEQGETMMSASLCDAGITVPGSESHQQFFHASDFPLESQSRVIVLKLRGLVAGQAVSQPVTVDLRPTCSTCGRRNKTGSQFCSQCGTSLRLL